MTIAGFSCPAGTLVFTGAQISRTGPNAYEITYNLAYDDEYHLRQVAKVDLSGKPMVGVLKMSGSTPSVSTSDTDITTADAGAAQNHAPGYAAFVMWKQPFASRTDFSNLGMTGLS